MPILLEVVIFFITGIGTGVLSSMFGIGGGLTIVPVSFLFFHLLGYPDDVVMHVALGTSMTVMLFTVVNGIIRHWREDHVVVPLVKVMLPVIGIGAILGALTSYWLHSDVLRYFFMAFLVFIIGNAWFDKSFHSTKTLQDAKPFHAVWRSIFGLVVGFVSVLLGMGGSVITVPYFRKHGLPMVNASACALCLTPCVAVFGMIGYLAAGLHAKGLPPHSIGFVNWPAALAIAAGTLIGVPYGVKWVKHLPDSVTAKCYIGLLVVMLIVMIV